jgi:hypothetical protein
MARLAPAIHRRPEAMRWLKEIRKAVCRFSLETGRSPLVSIPPFGGDS